jgi:hypothetical protein
LNLRVSRGGLYATIMNMALTPVFCYGSNNPDQLAERIGHRPKMEGAYLEGYHRIFVGFSRKWNGGVGSLEKAPGETVYGLVAYLSQADIKKLDGFEGWNPDNTSGSTIKENLKITTQGGKPLRAIVYLGTATNRNPPSRAYREAIAKTIQAFWSNADGSGVSWRDITVRRNPDEAIQQLKREYEATEDPEVLKKLINVCRRAGLAADTDKAEFTFLVSEIEAYGKAWDQYDRMKWGREPAERSGPNNYLIAKRAREAAYSELLLTREALTEKAKEIELSPSHHVYRRHDIPDTNHHLEKLATLHNAVTTYAGRDDDSYFGDCFFEKKQDALDFVEAMKRHHGYFGEEAHINSAGDGFSVTWKAYK